MPSAKWSGDAENHWARALLMTIKSQFEFIMGQEKEIIEELVLNGHKCNEGGDALPMGESISPPPLFPLFEGSAVTKTT